MFFDRAFPGSIIVNERGERFMNDASNYDQTGRAMADAAPPGKPDTPSYFIFDAHYRSNYIAGPLQPSPGFVDSFLPREIKDIVIKAPSMAALAEKLEIDPAALQHTVDRFNEFARRGNDVDFGRGVEAYERHYSDPKVFPNSTMAPITAAPFYAVPIYAGDIGTRGGLVTDKDGRVQDAGGKAIHGLYAIGNSSASIMGRTYPGGGVTIGPSMVFGARAAMHIAGKPLPE
jgi:3-oxosteroid 1-dehydrogenase